MGGVEILFCFYFWRFGEEVVAAMESEHPYWGGLSNHGTRIVRGLDPGVGKMRVWSTGSGGRRANILYGYKKPGVVYS